MNKESGGAVQTGAAPDTGNFSTASIFYTQISGKDGILQWFMQKKKF